jgi:Caspase domain
LKAWQSAPPGFRTDRGLISPGTVGASIWRAESSRFCFFACSLATDRGCNSAATAEKRVALLIGNAAYEDAPLANPGNDVAAMKDALHSAGFDAIEACTDLDRRAMSQAPA